MTERKNKQDREANVFAMNLLMPEEWIRADVAKYGPNADIDVVIPQLAKRYEVSIPIMTMRLIDLKLVHR